MMECAVGAAFARRVYGLSLKARIAALVLACFLPAWLYVGYLTLDSYQRRRAGAEETLLAAARSLSRSVEAEIAAAEAAMRVLATSSHLEKGDYEGFHRRADALLPQTPGLNIVLLGRDGAQILNTLKPFGAKLPNQPGAFFFRVLETGRPVLSDLFIGPVAGQPLVALAVPVFLDGRLEHVLSLSLDAKSFAPLLKRSETPDIWISGIFDATGTIVARSHAPEKYVGRKAVQAVLDTLQGQPEGLLEGETLEGATVQLAYSRSERYGWTAAFAVPKASLEAELRHSLWLSLVTGLTVLLAGLLLARKLAGDIATPIRALIRPAVALGHGEPIDPKPLGLKEADEVREALAAASRLIALRTLERDDARSKELDLSRQHRALRALSDIAALPGINAKEQLTEALALARNHLGLPLGIISRIDGDAYTVLHHDSGPEMRLEDDKPFPLGRTCCALTLDTGNVVAMTFMEDGAVSGHPCYQTFRLEAYIGAPLRVRDRPFGTIDFSSPMPLGRDFDASDREFMRLLARWVGAMIERDLANRDILAAKDAAEAAQTSLAIQAQSLTQSNADLEQFAYVASHDLRTPLRNVVSYAQLLERRYKGRLDADADDFLNFIIDNSKMMTVLISDLLEYSRASRQSDPLVPVWSGEAVAQALRNLEADVSRSGAEIRIAQLPQVMAVETYLVSLFQNLIGNAVKYRAPDRPPRISVTAEPLSPDLWQFAVADNGIGIDPAYHAKIFEIFQRLSPSQETEGTGIGLTLCRRIVHRFGGTIRVESKPNAGTTFVFTLHRVFTVS
jgi:signal transduction histidine kinase